MRNNLSELHNLILTNLWNRDEYHAFFKTQEHWGQKLKRDGDLGSSDCRASVLSDQGTWDTQDSECLEARNNILFVTT